MENKKTKSNYYSETIPKLIKKYKTAVEQCLDVIGQDMDKELSDDKLHNVLKAKRMAGEDAKYYAKEIDSLENEMNGVTEEEEKTKAPANLAKRFSQKPG